MIWPPGKATCISCDFEHRMRKLLKIGFTGFYWTSTFIDRSSVKSKHHVTDSRWNPRFTRIKRRRIRQILQYDLHTQQDMILPIIFICFQRWELRLNMTWMDFVGLETNLMKSLSIFGIWRKYEDMFFLCAILMKLPMVEFLESYLIEGNINYILVV